MKSNQFNKGYLVNKVVIAYFVGGMFALGAKTLENEMSEKYMNIAAGLTNTCHESYDRSATKLGPEAFHFIEGNEARSLKNGEKYYILRPEVSRPRSHPKVKLA